jgi:hypothetical protein
MGLSFKITAGLCQRTYSQVRVQWDSWPYFTASDSRLSQPGWSGPRIYIPQEEGGPVIPSGTGFPFRRLLRLAGLQWRYSTGLHTGMIWTWVETYVTSDGRSASLSWNKAPIWGLWTDFYYCQTIAGLLMWGSLSDERTDLSFTIPAGPCQRNHSRVRVPWDSRPCFIVSDSRLPYSSPPTTLRSTVEGLEPASTQKLSELSFVLRLYGVSVSMETCSLPSWFPRIHLHGNVFVNLFPSNGSTCHNDIYIYIYIYI